MPTYDYKCDACGHAFEKFQTMSAAAIKKCPKCGKNKVRRLIGTGAGLIFKGSGFYITDYRDSKYQEKAKADAGGGETKTDSTKSDGATAPAETKSAGESQTKSEPKAESKPMPATEKPAPATSSKPSKSDKK